MAKRVQAAGVPRGFILSFLQLHAETRAGYAKDLVYSIFGHLYLQWKC